MTLPRATASPRNRFVVRKRWSRYGKRTTKRLMR